MKKRLTTTRKDEIFKKFWNQKDRFASLLNTVLFEGKDMIRPEELSDSNDGKSAETQGEMNTVVKKTGHSAEFVLTGIEDPRDMPLQLLYQDSVGYLKECQEILKGRGENKDDMDEVLAALHEEDRLKPIINLVLYYGKEPWNGATSLKEMFPHVPEKIREVFPDYRINLIQARCFLQALFPQKCRLTSSKLHGEFPHYCISSSGTLSGAGEESLQAYKVY